MMDRQKIFEEYADLVQYLLGCSSEVAQFISAQIMLETGWLTSEVYKQNSNLFGMRYPKSRITTAFQSNLNHAQYHCDEDSVYDYMLWLVSFGFNQADLHDLGRFCSKLRKSPYNPSEKYVDTILEIFKCYNNNEL